MLNKRGQDSSVGMSFGMIFSIFLIIVFVAVAVIVIKVFLDFSSSADVGKFYTEFQGEVNDAWRSSQTSKKYKINVDPDIKQICFANLSAPITGDQAAYKEISDYQYYGYNTFMLPPGAAQGLDAKNIEHLDIEKITASSNPYCVSNPGEVTISKGIRSRLVMVS